MFGALLPLLILLNGGRVLVQEGAVFGQFVQGNV